MIKMMMMMMMIIIVIIVIFIHVYWCDVVYHDLYHIYSHDIMIEMVVNTMLYNRIKAISELIGSHSQLLSLPYYHRSRHSRGCPEAM